MIIKHKKYQNTGVLFELLVRQIASDTISGKDSPAVGIVKKYFSNTELSKEHRLYQTLINSSKVLSEGKAEILINTTLDLSKRLNKTILRKEKYNVIKDIKEHYNIDEFFKSKISYYKEYAAIYNLFESKNSKEFVDPTITINNKITLLEHISQAKIKKEDVENQLLEEYEAMDKGTRLLVYRLLLEKFNTKYSKLSEPQKIVLKEFINNISDTVKLRVFVNEEYTKIKKDLIVLTSKVNDQVTKIKLQEVINLTKNLNKNSIQNVKDEDIITLLQYHQLISDLKESNNGK